MTRIAEAQEWADQMAAYVAASKAALVGAEVAYQEAYQAEGAIGDPVTEVNLTLAYATLTAAREHLAENLKIRDRADMELDHALDHGDPPASKEDAKEAAERLLTVKRDLLAEADGAASSPLGRPAEAPMPGHR